MRPITQQKLTFIALLACSATLIAQVDTGVLNGTVSDGSGAVIPGANVEVLNTATNYRLTRETNASGLYVSPPLPPGPYRITVSTEGFRTAAKEVALNLSERIAVDFELEVGAVAESIDVEAIGTVLQTETATLSTLRSEEEVKELPNISRNFVDLMRYTAGVVLAQPHNSGLPLSQIRGSTVSSVNGGTVVDNNFVVDGLQNNSNHQGQGVMVFPEIEALEQYRVETSAPDARFGRTGGTLNMGYKSGTNEFHGSAFWFLRNDALDARNFFNTGDKTPLRRNMFGGTLGGPLGRKEGSTFFFVSYEGTRTRQSTTNIASVPTNLMRTGDFSEAVGRNRIFDPLTTTRNEAGKLVREPFANNSIPDSRFSPQGLAVLRFFPAPTGPGLAANFTTDAGNTQDADQGTVKIDRDFSGGSRGFFRLTRGRADFVNGFANILGPTATPFVQVQAPATQIVVSYTQIINARTINQVRVGFTRENLRATSLNGGRNTAEEFGIPNVNVDEYTTGLSAISAAGYPNIGDNFWNPAILPMNNIQFSDNLEMTRGNHSFRFGFDAVRRHTNGFQTSRPRGQFGFVLRFTNNPANARNTGFGPAELLLGKPGNIQLVYMQGTRGMRRTDYAGYFQDDWKVTQRLSLNLGLRYDLLADYPQTEVGDRLIQFDVESGNPAPVNDGRYPWRSGIADDLNNWAPRVGLAYRLGDGTVVRAAYGIYYNGQPIHLNAGLLSQAPFFVNTRVDNSQGNFEGARGLADGPLRVRALDSPGQSRRGYDPDSYAIPYTQQWNFAIQQQLPAQQQLTVAYVGSKATARRQQINFNQAIPGSGPVALRRRWPNHAAVRIVQTRGNTNYHSLQATLRKHFSRGLRYQLNYTWAHAIDESTGGLPITDLSGNRGNSSLDIRHSVNATVGYDLPVGQGKAVLGNAPAAVDQILGGWKINALLTLTDGYPFSPSGPNTLNIGEGTRPDRIADGNLPPSERTIRRWFDTDAFVAPGFRQFGNSGRNVLFGPGTKLANISLHKNFSVSEGKRLQFRAEFFNVTNTPHFNNPNSNIRSPARGRITRAGSENRFQRTQRLVQFGLRFVF
ncbi:MAG: TonB-dependent receptor [Bryobacterales bacterium]|nr:TonB-dependent receptor [Bryobacterales bacterium]